MFAFKKKYFLIIESIKDLDLRNIKKYNKILIIYRNIKSRDNIKDLIKFRKECRLKLIDFYVANDIKLSVLLNSDGIYLSSYNESFKALNLKKCNFKIIGSAHNIKEINLKLKQGCSYILLSKLFLVNYDISSSFLDVIKFNSILTNDPKKIIPLGGINSNNLNKLKSINCVGFALLSEIKKKPAKIINRLF
jgi:thiamine-phosphate pyrophosphorylase